MGASNTDRRVAMHRRHRMLSCTNATVVQPGPDPDSYPPIDPTEPVPDDPGELLPDTPETLPPAPVEPMPGPDDPGGVPAVPA
jgi:hypothetical protein